MTDGDSYDWTIAKEFPDVEVTEEQPAGSFVTNLGPGQKYTGDFFLTPCVGYPDVLGVIARISYSTDGEYPGGVKKIAFHHVNYGWVRINKIKIRLEANNTYAAYVDVWHWIADTCWTVDRAFDGCNEQYRLRQMVAV